MGPKLITYIRVSTQKQGVSGLGLEAQTDAIQSYSKQVGGEIAKNYTEIETGKNSNRVELAKAIKHCKRIKAKLVIAKLDRLARNMAFVANLMDSGVDFVCCDNQHANRLTLHILAAVAEDEGRRISERTKAALKVAKARGTLLGSARPGHWNGREHLRLSGAHKAGEAARLMRLNRSAPILADVRPIVLKMRAAGSTLNEIANHLNEMGKVTVADSTWGPGQVHRVLKLT